MIQPFTACANELSRNALRILRVTVPKDGCLLALAESYFDETNTHSSDERLCVGGYIFLQDAAVRQVERWQPMLDRWQLPYFHMVDCAHNVGVFAHLTAPECDLAAREAIAIIKETASAGVGVTILAADHLAIVPELKSIGSAYDACARDVISGVSTWADGNNFAGGVHYFFEAGTDTESNASHCILQMMEDPDIKQDARYTGHSFVPKKDSPGVQAADVLAWHLGQDCKRALRGDPIRKDYQSLLEIPHFILHLTPEMLRKRADIVESTLKEAGLTAEQVRLADDLIRRLGKRLRKHK